jgi:hypothetical protein
MREEYLGDGVYATFDGYHVWLDCRGQDGFSIGPGGHRAIALEPPVIARLNKFVLSMTREDSPNPTHP